MCTAPAAAPDVSAPAAHESGGAASYLVKQHDAANRDCTKELVKLGAAGLAVAGTSAAMVAATPTVVGVIPSIIGFVGASVTFGAAAAEYAECRDGK